MMLGEHYTDVGLEPVGQNITSELWGNDRGYIGWLQGDSALLEVAHRLPFSRTVMVV